MNQTESAEELLKALNLLDERLQVAGIDALELKIVGGFALIIHGVRDNGFTQDIDSMTKRFTPEVASIIAQVGKDLGIKLGWLNADMVLDDPEIIEEIVGALTFAPFGEFQVLQASIADLPSLLRLKIIAAGDNLEITRDEIEFERHFGDVKSIIKALGLTSFSELEKLAPLVNDYPELRCRLDK